ncbi:MAG: PilZ domain-containing protein [Nitrospiraceae bacterium]
MDFPFRQSEAYPGARLHVDPEREEISIRTADGTVLGVVGWEAVAQAALQQGSAASEPTPMIPLELRVRYQAAGTVAGEGMTVEFGGSGFFLETSTPLPVGTELSVEFALPDQPQRKIATKGHVVRVRQRPERQVLLPGMEVRFHDIAATDQQQVSALVSALERNRVAHRS